MINKNLKWWGSDDPYRICDVMDGLRSLPDNVVQCVVTSPPYYGLRDYGTATWEGGDKNCTHRRESKKSDKTITGHKNFDEMLGVGDAIQKDICAYCGAKRIDNQIGLEKTPEEYVQKMVEVFREVRRVLRDDGTVWLNLGDSYCGYKGDNYCKNPETSKLQFNNHIPVANNIGTPQTSGLKSKDLVGIPWRVAFALQADGWYLRSDIIWNKPNPMPESVTDRPTKSHEYIFLLTKSPKYYYDSEAIKEKGTIPAGTKGGYTGKEASLQGLKYSNTSGWEYTGTRNKRSVWNIATKPNFEAHFATFPPELPEICIKAGTSQKGCCPKCGCPWERIVERTNPSKQSFIKDHITQSGAVGSIRTRQSISSLHRNISCDGKKGVYSNAKTIGWQPTCLCGLQEPEQQALEPIPCIVLDPFVGSGTVIQVARSLGRIGLGFDLNPNYEKIIIKKTGGIGNDNLDVLWGDF